MERETPWMRNPASMRLNVENGYESRPCTPNIRCRYWTSQGNPGAVCPLTTGGGCPQFSTPGNWMSRPTWKVLNSPMPHTSRFDRST